MKKIIGLVLIATIFVVSVSACGKKEETQTPVVEETVTTNEGTTEEQTEEAEEQSNETQEFEVTIDVTGHWEDSSVVFELDTNLPDEAELMFTVSKGDYNTDDYFTAQGKKSVNEGHITSDGFSSSGEPLSGEYDLCVSMSLPRLQTDNVRNAIGENGEYMTGSLVEESEITGDKTINALFSVSVGDDITITPESDYSFTIFSTEEEVDEELEETEEQVQESNADANKEFIEKYDSEIVVAAKMTLDSYISDYKISLAPQNWTIAKFDETDTAIATTEITYNGIVGTYVYVGTLNFNDSGKVESSTPHYVAVDDVILADDGYCDDVFEALGY